MDNNLFFKKVGRLISNTLSVRLVNCGVRHVISYSPDYWPVWPASVLSFLKEGRIVRRQHGVDHEEIHEAPAYVAIPANVSHQSQILSSNGATFVWCHIHFHIMESFDLLSLLKQPIVLTDPKKVKKAGAINKQLIKKFPLYETCPATFAQSQSLIYSLLTILLESTEFRTDSDHLFATSEKLFPLLQELHKRYREQWTIEKMTRIACLSRSRLHTLFKELHGKPPLDYVTSIRLSKAQALLLKTDLPVGEIAEKVGYEDALYFSRRFSSALGVSPSNYRNMTNL